MNKNYFTYFLFLIVVQFSNAQLPNNLPTNGLVAYYPFNGNANDESGNGYNGIFNAGTNGTISYTFDRLGNNNAAILFESNPIWNSLGPFIELDNTENLLVNTDFTINYFVNISNSNLTGEIINKGPDNVPGNFISVALNNNILQNGVSQIGVVNDTNFPDDIWKMVTISNSGGLWNIYIDGILTQTSFIGFITNNSYVYNLGAMPSGGSNGSFWPFQGIIDDIGFWNRALTEEEITIINNNCTPPQAPAGDVQQIFCDAPTVANLTATGDNIQWYDAATEGNILDPTTELANGQVVYASQTVDDCESEDRFELTVSIQEISITASATEVCAGERVDLTVNSGLTPGSTACTSTEFPANLQTGLVGYWPFCGNANDESGNGNNGTVNGATLTTDRFGNADSAYSFDGVSNYIESNRIHLNTFTASVWINLNTSNCFSAILDAYPSSWEFLSDCISGTNLSTAIWNNPTTYEIYQSNYIIPQNVWINAVMSYGNNILNIYSEGNLVFTGTTTAPPALNGLLYFGRSRSGTDQFFNGDLDDIAIWNKILTPEEINQLYTPSISYLWSTSDTTETITVTLTETTEYWVDVTTNGVTCREYITINVTDPPEAPISNGDVTDCEWDPMPTLTAQATVNPSESITWYDTATGGNVVTDPSWAQVGSITYYADAVDDATGCVSETRTPVALTIEAAPAAPVGDTTQTFCDAPTISDLSAIGDNIQWYDAITGGNSLEATTTLNDGQMVYASQTVNGCESIDRMEVTVTIPDIQIIASETEICSGEEVTISFEYQVPTICDMDITLTDIPFGDDIPGFSYGGFYNNHHYYVYNSPTSWTEGEEICRQNGGYLVCINSEEENTFVSNLTDNNIWIGLFRDPDTCEFRWLDCIDITFTNWRPGEPNSGPCGEPYAQIIRGCSFGYNTWNNLGNNSSNGPCYSNMVPIMEIDPSIYESNFDSNASFLWSTGDTTTTVSVTPTETTEYWVDITTNGVTCREFITINVTNPPAAPVSNGDITDCTSNTIPTITAEATVGNGESIVWYDAPVGGNIINSPILNNVGSVIYYAEAVNNTTGCKSLVRTAVRLDLLEEVVYNSPLDLEACDDSNNDGTTTFNLSIQNSNIIPENSPENLVITYYNTLNDAESGLNPLPTSIISGNATIYTRIESGASGCYNIESFQLILHPYPTANILEEYVLCGDNLTITPGNGFNNYQWSTGETSPSIVVSEPGLYEVIITSQNGCNATFNFNVLTSSIATIANVEINLSNNSQNTLIVSAFGLGEYRYSLDGILFQESPVFYNVLPGRYTLYVQDINGCETVTQDVSVIGVPNFFTPNGDGVNDYWQVIESLSIPSAKIFIFDRYGKLLKQLSPNSNGWDGTFNGRSMPTNDYWYRIELDNGEIFMGHFTLKR